LKTKILGKTFVATSSIPADDIKLLAEKAPEKLTVQDDKGNHLFAVSFNEKHKGITPQGIAFDGISDCDQKFATLSGTIPDTVDTKDAIGHVADYLSGISSHFGKLEKTIPAAASGLREKRKKILENIEKV